jgi:hypothetical protein
MGGSPSLKLTVTLPALMRLVQSSTTCTTIAVGHATGVVNPPPIEVNSGNSFVGAHPVALGVTARLVTVPPPGEITSSKSTVWVLPSWNVSCIVAGYTLALSAEVAGVTVIGAVCPGPTVPDFGLKSNQFGAAVAVALKVMVFEVRFEMLND